MHVNIDPQPGQLAIEGRVTMREYYGLYIKYYIDLGSQTVKVIEKNDGVRIYEVGQQVSVIVDPRDVMAYPPDEKNEVTK
jgi:iron(III) transport system ATP-binding protein